MKIFEAQLRVYIKNSKTLRSSVLKITYQLEGGIKILHLSHLCCKI